MCMTLPKRKNSRSKRINYTSTWCYFVTICTQWRKHYFGKINDGSMNLNLLWRYTKKCLMSICERRKTVDIDVFVIMPNHIHMLITMDNFHDWMNQKINNTRNRRDDLLGRPNYENGHAKSVSLQEKFNPNYKWPSLWSIVGMFKGAITKFANAKHIKFWRQSRYHDHLVRNDSEYERISYYIEQNPQKWNEDRFFEK